WALAYGAAELVNLGEGSRAKQWALRALATEPDDPGLHYNLAGVFSQMGETERSLDLLESCVPKLAAEYVDWIKKDTDLVPLRAHPRYQALIARAEARLAALQTAPTSH